MNLGSSFAPLVRHQGVFQAEMIETNRLCRFWKQVNYRSATQTKNLFVYDQILTGPAVEQKQYVDALGRLHRVEIVAQRSSPAAFRIEWIEAKVKKEILFRESEILL